MPPFVIRLCAGALVAAAALGPACLGEPAAAQSEAKTPALEDILDKYFPGEEGEAAPRRLFRLTRHQIDATARALMPGLALPSVTAHLPRDPLQTNYEYAELLSFNQANLSPLRGWIGEVAAAVRKKPETVAKCGAGDADKACLADAARRFAVTAFRGDVVDQTIDQTVDLYLSRVKEAGLAQGTADLVTAVLSSPHFLFRKELSTSRRGGRVASPTLLQALAYTLADAPPDALGLDSALALEHLQTPDRREAAIATIMASPAAREKLVRFFKAWLEIKEPADFTISAQVFPEFTPALSKAMVQETESFLRTHLATPAPSLKDITHGVRSEVPPALAAVYKLDQTPAKRLGIFSQASVIASHSGPVGTQLVKRGVFWVRKVMCMNLEPPPPDAHKAAYAEAVTTERQRIDQSTRTGACYGCHKIINPFGFMLESYDPLGRWRETENGHPVDASVTLDFLDEPPVEAKTPVEALRVLSASHRFQQCFVRQMFRFYMGRKEEPSDDPVLRHMYTSFAADGRQQILAPLRQLVASNRLTRRQ